jgi:glycerol-1-phosphate dehydrogenase [NAD(P)+]
VTNLKEYRIQDLINREMECSCGRDHFAAIEDLMIRKEAMAMLPDLLTKYSCKRLFLVADENTYDAAGEKVEQILKEKGFELARHIFRREKSLVPDEKAIGEFLLHLNRNTDMIVAVGAGTLNDLSKYISYQSNIPYVIVATAPSMDGYSSFGAPLIVDNLKTTYQVAPPKAIIADVHILKRAPLSMMQAGLGDMLGKYTGLCDWELARIINGEYYCDQVADLMRKSIEKCTSHVSGIQKRDETAIINLTEGLILSGIAMSFIGNARPASGSEHHLAHFWEMMFLFSGKEAVLHGTKVGIATVAVIKLFHLLEERPEINFAAAVEKVSHFDREEWAQQMNRIYQAAAPSVIAMEKNAMKNSIEKHKERIKIIAKRWPEIIRTIHQMIPEVDTIEKILQEAGAPINPMQVGIDADTFLNGLVYGKEVRNRYGILQLLWDLGLLEELSQQVVDYFYREQLVKKNLSRAKSSKS